MAAWWTYHLGDFLLFSPRVYWRLIERHNQAVWPLQVFALVIGAFILFALLRPRPWTSRTTAALLAAGWLYVAWGFLASRYATINWPVIYVVPFFVLESLLLLGWGTLGGCSVPRPAWDVPSRIGLSLLLYALVAHPLVAAVAGRPWAAAEVLGIFPDPTAIATLGVILGLRSGTGARVLLVIPAMWCLISFFTLLAMAAPSAWLPVTAVGLTLVAALWPF